MVNLLHHDHLNPRTYSLLILTSHVCVFCHIRSQEYVQALELELRAISELAIVNSVALIGGAKDELNLVRVRANLKAEFVPIKSMRQPYVACNSKRPTQLHAARELREMLAVKFASELRAAGAKAVPQPATATPFFDCVLAGGLAHRALITSVKESHEDVISAREQEEAATQRRVECERREKEAREALKAFEPKQPSHKKQRTAFAPPKQIQQDTLVEVEECTPTKSYWADWGLPKWNELEQKSFDRRNRSLSSEAPARLPNEMPRGQHSGALDHPRHGLIGALCYWAEGSQADATNLISSLIKRLNLQVRMPPQLIH